MKPVYIVLIVLGAIILIVGLPMAFTFSWFKANTTDSSGVCDSVEIEILDAVKVSEGTYEIEVKRASGKGEIGGLILYLFDEEGIGFEGNPSDMTVSGDIKKSLTKTLRVSDLAKDPAKIEVAVYFLDKFGSKKGCPISGSLEIA